MQIRLKEVSNEPPVTVPIYDTFALSIRYINPKRRQDLRDKAFIRRNQEVNDEQAKEQFAKSYVAAIFGGDGCGWVGLTTHILTEALKLDPVDEDLAKLKDIEAKNGGTIPYDEGIAVPIFRYGLKVQQKIIAFLEERDDEVRKAETDRGNASAASSVS